MVPEKLKKGKDKEVLFDACDDALEEVINTMKPSFVIGIGKFAEKRVKEVVEKIKEKKKGKEEIGFITGGILHPSPASPLARNWIIDAPKQLKAIGVKW